MAAADTDNAYRVKSCAALYVLCTDEEQDKIKGAVEEYGVPQEMRERDRRENGKTCHIIRECGIYANGVCCYRNDRKALR